MADKFRNIQELAADVVSDAELVYDWPPRPGVADKMKLGEVCERLVTQARQLEQRIETQLELNRALQAVAQDNARKLANALNAAEYNLAGQQCPACDYRADPDAKFCGGCGEVLP